MIESGNYGYWLGYYEPEAVRWVARTLHSGQTAFDIGAHAGYYSLLLSSKVGNTGRVYSFEPAPWNIPNLRRNLALNDVHNVEVVEAAVSDESGLGILMAGGDSFTGRLVSKDVSICGSKAECRKVCLDKFVLSQRIERVDFLKVDAEGEEWRILKGAEKTLGIFRPYMLLAIHDLKSAKEMRQFLSGIGYKVESPFPRDDQRHDKLIMAGP